MKDVVLITNDNTQHVVTEQQTQGWEWFRPLLSSQWSPRATHQVELSSENVESWLSLVSGGVEYYTDVVAAVDYFLPTDDKWLAHITGLDALEDDGERFSLRERAGRVLRQKKMPSYPPVLRLELQGNFMLHLDPAYDVPQYRSPATEDELAQALDLTELSVLTSVMHDAYNKSVAAGDYVEGMELPWYHVDFRDVVVLKRPNILVELRTDERGTLDRAEIIKLLRGETEAYTRYYASTGPFPARLLSLTVSSNKTRPTYTQRVLGSNDVIEDTESYYDEVYISTRRYVATGLTDITLGQLPRAVELYAKVLSAMMFREDNDIVDRLNSTGLYRLTNYRDEATMTRDKASLGGRATMREVVPRLTASLLYRKMSKGTGGWYVRAITAKEHQEVVDYALATVGSSLLVEIAEFMLLYYNESGDGKALAFAETVLACTPEVEVPPTQLP